MDRLKLFALLAFFAFSCSDLERDNPLDPKSDRYKSGPCAGFVDGTERKHQGKNKPQFCDERDGKKYVYVEIGSQIWMAENLNYKAEGSTCYNNNESYCNTYGGLYNWATAMNLPDECNSNNCTRQIDIVHQGICPEGWHIPTNDERIVSSSTDLKAISGWYSNGSGTDKYGFSALPGGLFADGNFVNIDNSGYWWSATEFSDMQAYHQSIYYGTDWIVANNLDKARLVSVRCVKND